MRLHRRPKAPEIRIAADPYGRDMPPNGGGRSANEKNFCTILSLWQFVLSALFIMGYNVHTDHLKDLQKKD